jgi:hypothetical protein
MKEFLRIFEGKNYDGLNFHRNDEGFLAVDSFLLKNFGQKLPGSEIGELYDIIIYNDGRVEEDPERFQAILISPLHYISRMMDDGFLGVVAKATTTSEIFMEDIFRNLKEVSLEYRKKLKEIEEKNVSKI